MKARTNRVNRIKRIKRAEEGKPTTPPPDAAPSAEEDRGFFGSAYDWVTGLNWRDPMVWGPAGAALASPLVLWALYKLMTRKRRSDSESEEEEPRTIYW